MNDKLQNLKAQADRLKEGIDQLIQDLDDLLDDEAQTVGLEDFVDLGLIQVSEPTEEELKIFRAKDATEESPVFNEAHNEETVLESELEKTREGRDYLTKFRLKKEIAKEAVEGTGHGAFRRSG
jgi:hypothetical protein